LDAARVKWLPEADVEAAAHTISVASDAPLPELAPALGVATMVEYQDWQQTLNTAAERNRALERRVVQLEEQVRDRVALQERLLDAEQRLAEVPGLEQRIERLELAADELVDASEQGLRALHEGHQRELAAKDAEVAAARVEPDALRGEVAALRERLARADRTLAEVFASPSWRITKPLRRLKARLQG
jgi:chromosome segregation ATPase